MDTETKSKSGCMSLLYYIIEGWRSKSFNFCCPDCSSKDVQFYEGDVTEHDGEFYSFFVECSSCGFKAPFNILIGPVLRGDYKAYLRTLIKT